MIYQILMSQIKFFAKNKRQQKSCQPVINNAPHNSARAVEHVGNDADPCEEMVVVDEGEAVGLGVVPHQAVRQAQGEESYPNLKS